MENPQAQMQQGQPGPAPEQMQQGAPQGQPQQGGQDPQMQQIMQLVQQMMQQGVQPVEAAAELLSKQVPPEIVMQVFVQLGMPEQDAQAAIEQAMQGGQQPQGQGEEQREGSENNSEEEDEDEDEQEGSPMSSQMQGQPPMAFGGQPRRMLRKRAEGGGMDPQQELQAVMEQIQGMMDQGADARQVMEQIQAAAQQGQISPEVATSVMEQLSGMQQATNPQGDDAAMAEQSQDPQMMDPNMAAPEAQMMKFGGNLKKLMSRAYGGPAVAPGTDSKTYAKDRTSMFVGAVKNSAYKSTLDDEFPSLGGNQMAYGGNLPKALDGFDVSKYKTASEAELEAYRYKDKLAPEEQAKFNVSETLKTWKEPEFKPESGKQYELDPTTGKLKVVEAKDDGYVRDANGNVVGLKFQPPNQSNQGYGAINPVAYQNPMGNGFWDNVNAGTSPFARMLSGIGTNNMYDPRITGSNLPGGMNANQFLGAIGPNGLVPGMAGKIGEQNWRVGEAEKFKEGSIWKGNRRKGVRYQIDWGDAAAMNPAANTPGNAPGYTAGAASPGQSGYNADANGDGVPDYMLLGNEKPGSASTVNNATVANQNLVNPASTDVINPSSEVNQVDQTTNTGTDAAVDKNLDSEAQRASIIKEMDQGFKNPETKAKFTPASDENDNYFDRKDFRSDKQYYKSLYPDLNKSDINRISKSFSLGEDPYDMAPGYSNDVEKSKVYESKQDIRNTRQEDRQANRAENKEARQEFVSNVKGMFSGKRFEYGGGVDPAALENAIALINRAFGGRIPRADNGMDLGTEDANGNKIPDYLETENLPANQPDTFDKNGTIEQSAGKKLDINWNQVGAAAGDMYMNAASKVTNFANKMNAINPERDMAKLSALNRPSNTYDTMKQGLYGQQGDFIPNDIGNQVLNPTNTYYNNQRQIFAYGGKVYEIGGEVDLADDEMEQLAAAGFKLSRV